MAKSNNDKKDLYMFDLEDEKTELIIRRYFLEFADKLTLTRTGSIGWDEAEVMGDDDPKFIKTAEMMKSDLIVSRKEKDNDSSEYRLSSKMKKLINKNTLNWFSVNMDLSKVKHDEFYGFCSPHFFRGGELLGWVHSIKVFAELYLTPEEAKKLNDQGKLKPKSEYCENPR